ncbi:MAG: nucleoside 2-deoxyribosyltransferase, partial [Ligilactobacillus salivarius]|nr:nucleoside 2-deoxyribosyltransferase [Ligilactobacillus salivarius]
RPKKMNLMIAQGVTAIIDGNTELEKLAEYDFNWTPYIPVTGYGIY